MLLWASGVPSIGHALNRRLSKRGSSSTCPSLGRLCPRAKVSNGRGTAVANLEQRMWKEECADTHREQSAEYMIEVLYMAKNDGNPKVLDVMSTQYGTCAALLFLLLVPSVVLDWVRAGRASFLQPFRSPDPP